MVDDQDQQPTDEAQAGTEAPSPRLRRAAAGGPPVGQRVRRWSPPSDQAELFAAPAQGDEPAVEAEAEPRPSAEPRTTAAAEAEPPGRGSRGRPPSAGATASSPSRRPAADRHHRPPLPPRDPGRDDRRVLGRA